MGCGLWVPNTGSPLLSGLKLLSSRRVSVVRRWSAAIVCRTEKQEGSPEDIGTERYAFARSVQGGMPWP